MDITKAIATGETKIVDKIITLAEVAGEKGLISKHRSSVIVIKVGLYWLLNIFPKVVGYEEASKIIEEKIGYLLNEES